MNRFRAIIDTSVIWLISIVFLNLIMELMPLLLFSLILKNIGDIASFLDTYSDWAIIIPFLSLMFVMIIIMKLRITLSLNQLVQRARYTVGIAILSAFASKRSEKDGDIQDNARLILSEADFMVNSWARPIERIVSGCMLTMAILLYLALENFTLAITILAVTVVPFILIYTFVRNRITQTGKIRFLSNQRRFNATVSYLQLWREARIFGIGGRLLESFAFETERFYKSIAMNYTISSFPKFFLELLLVFITIVYALMSQHSWILEIRSQITITDISIFIFGIIKLIPSINQIFAAVSMLKFGDATLTDVISSINKTTAEKLPILHTSKQINQLRINCIRVAYESKNLEFKNFAFEKRNVIVGPSGSGKTTLVDSLLGLRNADVFDVTVNGSQISATEILSVSSYCPQFPKFFDGTIAENIVAGETFSDDRLSEVLEVCNLTKLNIHTEIDNFQNSFSGGQLLRIGIARAIYKNASILILDEPQSALDSVNASEIIQNINSFYAGILIIISHSSEKFNSDFNFISLNN